MLTLNNTTTATAFSSVDTTDPLLLCYEFLLARAMARLEREQNTEDEPTREQGGDKGQSS